MAEVVAAVDRTCRIPRGGAIRARPVLSPHDAFNKPPRFSTLAISTATRTAGSREVIQLSERGNARLRPLKKDYPCGELDEVAGLLHFALVDDSPRHQRESTRASCAEVDASIYLRPIKSGAAYERAGPNIILVRTSRRFRDREIVCGRVHEMRPGEGELAAMACARA